MTIILSKKISFKNNPYQVFSVVMFLRIKYTKKHVTLLTINMIVIVAVLIWCTDFLHVPQINFEVNNNI